MTPIAALASVLLLFSSSSAQATGDGRVVVTVVDQSGAARWVVQKVFESLLPVWFVSPAKV